MPQAASISINNEGNIFMTDSLFGYQTKNHGTLFLLCWAAYFSTYLCRLNYSAVMPELSGGNVFSSAQIASVSSVFFICYGAGQLLSGILGDRLDTRRMIFGGLFISSLSNILIFFFHSFPVPALSVGSKRHCTIAGLVANFKNCVHLL